MNGAPSTPAEQRTSQEMAELVDELAARLQRGEPCDIDEYAKRYPLHADRLRDWFNAMATMADLGHSIWNDDAPAPPGLPSSLGTGSAHPISPTHIAAALGDFLIVREIGRGGMGVVYEAEQLSLGRRVALKVLPFAAMLDKQQLARFKNEARAAATLDHPNIVAIHSVGVERGVHYYAMQLIEGHSLAQLIAEQHAARGMIGDPSDGFLPATTALSAIGGSPHSTRGAEDAAAETKRDVQAALSTLPAFNSREETNPLCDRGGRLASSLAFLSSIRLLIAGSISRKPWRCASRMICPHTRSGVVLKRLGPL